jgi:hypothetical protein
MPEPWESVILDLVTKNLEVDRGKPKPAPEPSIYKKVDTQPVHPSGLEETQRVKPQNLLGPGLGIRSPQKS